VNFGPKIEFRAVQNEPDTLKQLRAEPWARPVGRSGTARKSNGPSRPEIQTIRLFRVWAGPGGPNVSPIITTQARPADAATAAGLRRAGPRRRSHGALTIASPPGFVFVRYGEASDPSHGVEALADAAYSSGTCGLRLLVKLIQVVRLSTGEFMSPANNEMERISTGHKRIQAKMVHGQRWTPMLSCTCIKCHTCTEATALFTLFFHTSQSQSQHFRISDLWHATR
jgi:hypothetical protein